MYAKCISKDSFKKPNDILKTFRVKPRRHINTITLACKKRKKNFFSVVKTEIGGFY